MITCPATFQRWGRETLFLEQWLIIELTHEITRYENINGCRKKYHNNILNSLLGHCFM